MWIVSVLLLLAGGILAAANLIVAKRPDAQAVIAKLSPFQGYIGIILLLWGIFDAVNVLRALSLVSAAPFWFIVFVLVTIAELGLGFLLGYSLIAKYALGGSPQALARSEAMRLRLAPHQSTLGLIAIGVSLLLLLTALLRRST